MSRLIEDHAPNDECKAVAAITTEGDVCRTVSDATTALLVTAQDIANASRRDDPLMENSRKQFGTDVSDSSSTSAILTALWMDFLIADQVIIPTSFIQNSLANHIKDIQESYK